MEILDLFCGIGGVAEAARQLGRARRACESLAEPLRSTESRVPRVTAAIDIDRRIAPVYEANHGIAPRCQTLESVRKLPEAELWWLSPPCQPYTRRGRRRENTDPRSAALEHLIVQVDRCRPRKLVLENVPQFAGSAHHLRLVDVLRRRGYSVRTDTLCPTELGVPARRRRVYLRARRDGPVIAAGISSAGSDVLLGPARLVDYVDPHAWGEVCWEIPASLLRRYANAVHVINPNDPHAVAGCFTSAYGTSPVRAGSYLRDPRSGKVRRFAPREIVRVMGFRSGFWWPESIDWRTQYRLLGNSLSVPVVKRLLATMI